jgi:hypothetical protein
LKLIRPEPPKKEEKIVDISFNVHKFNNRPRPKDPNKIVIIGSFSEFGCETVSVLYSIPIILQQCCGRYVIIVGWYGREYLYRHLADEFWELKEEFQWLREYSRAFHHQSENLKQLETRIASYGKFFSTQFLSIPIIHNRCSCGYCWSYNDDIDSCPKCHNTEITRAVFKDVPFWKRLAIKLPSPSREKLYRARTYVKENTVGIFARARKTYGRNLTPEFYVDLIKLVRELGYEPIWLGEKTSILPCPVDDVVDFAYLDESKDLELTFAIVRQCKFTIQFWTASTRIAGMQGIPYLLFESPDQIWGIGQEGYRRNLCDWGSSKLCVSHFLSVLDNPKEGLALVKRCIEEMQVNNYDDVFGMLENEMVARTMRHNNLERIGGVS